MLFNVSAFLTWPKDLPMAEAMVKPACLSTVMAKTYIEAPFPKTAARWWLETLTEEERAAVDLVVVYRTPRKVKDGYLGKDRTFRPQQGWEERSTDRYDAKNDLIRMGGTWRES